MDNHLLSILGRNGRARLSEHLEQCELNKRQELEAPNRPIEHIYFIETGIAAVVSISKHRRIALGLIGCEGASGLAIFLGDDRSPHSTVMLCEGTGWRIAVGQFRKLMEEPQLERLFRQYAAAFFNQAAHTALSNTLALIEQRVARWVLMTHDRVEVDTIPLTHEAIAFMLGIRRSGVSEALTRLSQQGLVKLERGALALLDRKGVEKIAGEFYGIPEGEYARLIGWPRAANHRRSADRTR
jgi:CRP-like cAMP-binding protein